MKTAPFRKFTLLVSSVLAPSTLFLVGSFSASAAGNLTDTPGIPDLIYDPTTGNMTMDTEGLPVTSFQFENGGAGTFASGNYISPADSPNNFFGFSFEQVNGNVIADSDALNAGFTGLHDFGNVLPTGLTQGQLKTYLSTAFYGTFGSGSGDVDLIIAGAVPFVLELGIAESGGGPGFDLTWTNREFKTYDVETAIDLSAWEAFDPDGPGGPLEPFTAIPYSGSETNSVTVNTPSDPGRFFRVLENNEVLYFENFDGAGFASGFPAGWVAEAVATEDFATFPDPGNLLPEVATIWEVGTPAGVPSPGYAVYDAERDGPAGASSATRCLGTNIANGYCGRAWFLTLTSPAIPIENISAPLLLSFQQWLSGATFTSTVDVGGVAVLDALNGDSVVAALSGIGDNPVWSTNQLEIPLETVADLTLDGGGQASIKLQFTFSSSSNNSMANPDPVAGFREPVAGFYVDDVKVEYNLSE